jgi:hypothetical protein
MFSPDSKRLAYLARREQKWLAVVDGAEGGEYDLAGVPLFSPDSKRFAYIAGREKKFLVIVDGVDGKKYDLIGMKTRPYYFPGHVSSSDSKYFAYVAQRGGKFIVVVDGVEGNEYDRWSGARPVFEGPDKLRAVMMRDNEVFLVEIGIQP